MPLYTPRALTPLLSLCLAMSACGGATSNSALGTGIEPGGAATEQRVCTAMACSPEAAITAHVGATDAALGTHTFTVDADGTLSTCRVDVTSQTSHSWATCTGSISLYLGPSMRQIVDTTTMPGMVGVSEAPIPGRFEWKASIYGTPARVRIVHSFEGRTVVDRESSLRYGEFSPNGPGCEPVCQHAADTWELAATP